MSCEDDTSRFVAENVRVRHHHVANAACMPEVDVRAMVRKQISPGSLTRVEEFSPANPSALNPNGHLALLEVSTAFNPFQGWGGFGHP